MFWKVMGIVWTLMFVGIVGLHVSYYGKAGRCGHDRTEATHAAEAPAGTQATAIIAAMPSDALGAADAIVHFSSVINGAVTGEYAAKLDRQLRIDCGANGDKYLSARTVGTGDAANVMIDVRNCPTVDQADFLAHAVAESFIKYVRDEQIKLCLSQVKFYENEEMRLKRAIESRHMDITTTVAGSQVWVDGAESAIGDQRQILLRQLADATLRQTRAQHRWDAYSERQAQPKATPATAPGGSVKVEAKRTPEAQVTEDVLLREELEGANKEVAHLMNGLLTLRHAQKDMTEKLMKVKAWEREISRFEEDLGAVRKQLQSLRRYQAAAEQRPYLMAVSLAE